MLGLDRKSTKKRRNKKFGECNSIDTETMSLFVTKQIIHEQTLHRNLKYFVIVTHGDINVNVRFRQY